MDLQLTDKTALVTGSTAGIGLAIATSLAGEGASVWINGRTQARVDEAITSIRKKHPQAKLHALAADLSTDAGITSAIKSVPAVDILVNNLGIFKETPFDKITDEEWRQFFEVNVLAGARLARAYFSKMLQNNWGRIIFISSESGYQIPKEMIHYGVTKSAQIALARGLAELTAGTAVTVNSVLPGPTDSEGVEKMVKQMGAKDVQSVEKKFFSDVRPTSLLKRFETTQEIGDVVAFIASPLASAINGTAVRADGGVVKSAF